MEGHLSCLLGHIQGIYQVESLVKDLVHKVEIEVLTEEASRYEHAAEAAKQVSLKLLSHIDFIQNDRQSLTLESFVIKEKAKTVREKFAVEITQVLRTSRRLNDFQYTIRDNEAVIAELKSQIKVLEDEVVSLRPVKSVSASSEAAVVLADGAKSSHPAKFFADAKNEIFFEIFSYLATIEVLNLAQVNRYMFWRIDGIFGTESGLVQLSWSQRPVCFGGTPAPVPTSKTVEHSREHSQDSGVSTSSSAVVSNGAQAGGSNSAAPAVGLTREMADTLSKRLTPVEIKAILALNEKLRSTTSQLAAVTAERDDLKQKSQVRC